MVMGVDKGVALNARTVTLAAEHELAGPALNLGEPDTTLGVPHGRTLGAIERGGGPGGGGGGGFRWQVERLVHRRPSARFGFWSDIVVTPSHPTCPLSPLDGGHEPYWRLCPKRAGDVL